ncbi:hypothetical protein BDW68DRAFT_182353 [Aspergillus falconensis]
MKSPSLTHLILLVSLGQAPSISLPPLIPHIPGVEALNNIVPPLPILQVPTAALDSPPSTPSNIKPKQIGYFWTGAGGKQHKGFLATHSLGDDTFGRFDLRDRRPRWSAVFVEDTGHCLLLRHVESVPPKFLKSNRAVLSSIADEIRAKLDGGFYITYMGSALGTSPGRLVETDADFNIIHEWPRGCRRPAQHPRGAPINILKPSLRIRRADTLHLWYLGSKKILNTITIPETIQPERKDRIGKPGVAEFLYGLSPKARDAVAIYTDISQDGRFLYPSSQRQITSPPSTSPTSTMFLDDRDEDQPTIGPYYVKVTPDQRHLVVTDYFVQTGKISLINTPADLKALYIDINDDGSLSFSRSIDFSREFANRGGAKPHSTVVFDLTDPENPL